MEKFSAMTAFAIAKTLLYSQFISEDDFNETVQSLMDGTLTIRGKNGENKESKESKKSKKVRQAKLASALG